MPEDGGKSSEMLRQEEDNPRRYLELIAHKVEREK
jgi:hypothetical protein